MLGFDQMVDGVDAKSIDAAVEPESHDGQHRLGDLRIAPVEVGLFLEKGMIVVLSCCFVPLPRAATELADPIVGRAAVGLAVAPDIPIAFGVAARRAAGAEPRMLVGGMVGHVIENDLEPVSMHCRDQPIEPGEISELGIDRRIVADVVTEIGHRRGEDWRDPDRIDAQLDQIIEAREDPVEITDAVPVRILKRARVDLIDDAPLPPGESAWHSRAPTTAVRSQPSVFADMRRGTVPAATRYP